METYQLSYSHPFRNIHEEVRDDCDVLYYTLEDYDFPIAVDYTESSGNSYGHPTQFWVKNTNVYLYYNSENSQYYDGDGQFTTQVVPPQWMYGSSHGNPTNEYFTDGNGRYLWVEEKRTTHGDYVTFTYIPHVIDLSRWMPNIAIINWGDGTAPSTGAISPVNWLAIFHGGTVFSVSGSHTYWEEGNFTIGITVYSSPGLAVAFDSRPVEVSTAGLYEIGGNHYATGHEDLPLNETIAEFRNPNPNEGIEDLRFEIDWGDGTWSWVSGASLLNGQVAGDIWLSTVNGTYVVGSQHVYAEEGYYWATVHVWEEDFYEESSIYSYPMIHITNSAPVANAETYSVSHRGTLSVPNGMLAGVLANDSDAQSDPLSAVLDSSTSHGVLNLSASGGFTYTPSRAFVGEDSFVYRAYDGQSYSDPMLVTITVTNAAPVAVGDELRVSHDRQSILQLLANDTDADGDPLSIILVGDVSHGTLTQLPNGQVQYEPDPSYLGPDSFTYRITDGFATSEPITVSLTVKNDPPMGQSDVFVLSHDRILKGNVRTNDNDVDGDAMTVTLVSPPAEGTFELRPDGSFTYSPPGGFRGSVVFQYQLSDGIAVSQLVTATIVVKNDSPVVQNDNVLVIHDRKLTFDVTANDTDADGDSLQLVLESYVTYGTLTVNAQGFLEYQPVAGYTGPDSFTYRLTDGLSDSQLATVFITVTNRAPVGVADARLVRHDKPYTSSGSVLSNDTDADGDQLKATLVQTTAHGKLTFREDGTFDYLPDVNYVGSDSFAYVAYDGVTQTAITTVILNVTQTVPTVQSKTFENHPHDQTLIGKALATDSDGDTLTYELRSSVTWGMLRFHSDGWFAFSPPPGEVDDVTFTYRVFDGIDYSADATVTIQVLQGPPTAVADPDFEVFHDRKLSGSVLANDVDPQRVAGMKEPLIAELVTPPQHGTLAFNSDGTFVYLARPLFHDNDAFTYRIFDGRSWSDAATVTIAVLETAPYDPDPAGDKFDVLHDRFLHENVLEDDKDDEHDAITALLVNAPLHASQFSFHPDGSFTYVPLPGFTQTDSFTYKVSDGIEESAPITVVLDVVQNAPISVSDVYRIGHDRGFSGNIYDPRRNPQNQLLPTDRDEDGDPLEEQLINLQTGQPTDVAGLGLLGSLQWHGDGSFYYQAPVEWGGTERFGYRLFDGLAYSDIATVEIIVTRTPPVARNDSFTIGHNQQLVKSVLLNDSDADDDGLTAQLYDPLTGSVVSVGELGLQGTLQWSSSGGFTYSPPGQWSGQDQFHYRVFDGLDYSEPATVTIGVNPTGPVVAGETYRVKPGTAYYAPVRPNEYRPHLLRNDQDGQSDAIFVSWVSGVENGTLNWNANGSFTYLPDVGFQGIDGFSYRVSDGFWESELVRATFIVDNRAPVATNDKWSIVQGTGRRFSVVNNDRDADNDVLTATLIDSSTGSATTAQGLSLPGTLEWDDRGEFFFQPANDFVGTVIFSYRLTDGWDSSEVRTVSIEVLGREAVNHAPVAKDDRYFVGLGHVLSVPKDGEWEGDVEAIPLLFSDRDADNDTLTVEVVASPTHGQLVMNPDGSFTYTANDPIWSGTDQFTYRLWDGLAYSNAAVATIEVGNRPPVAKHAKYQLIHDQTLNTTLFPESRYSTLGGLGKHATDKDEDTLVFTVVAGVERGQLTMLPGGHFIYVPNPGFVGHDRFLYQVSDGHATSSVFQVILEVQNLRPGAETKVFYTPYDRALTASVPAAKSNDGDPSIAILAGGPFYGNLSLAPDGSFVYTPNPGFVGTDTFTYVWQDVAPPGSSMSEGLESNFATITINVRYRAPVGKDDAFLFAYDQGPGFSGNVLTNDTDGDGDALVAELLTSPQHGTLQLSADGSFVYMPFDPNFVGTDEFTYQAKDARAESIAVRAKITISPLSVHPSANFEVSERVSFQRELATVTSSIVGLQIESLTATIKWGDGRTEPGTLVAVEGGFRVEGQHEYSKDGNYTITVEVADNAGNRHASMLQVTVLDTAPDAFMHSMLTAVKGVPFQGKLATFHDDSDARAEDFTATISWGDGKQTPGYVTAGMNGTFYVEQGHLYDRRGTFAVVVTLVDPSGVTTLIEGQVTVDHQVVVYGRSVNVGPGQTVEGVVGSFSSNNPKARAGDFLATIDWGDGYSTLGLVNGQGGSFQVSGTHTYLQGGAFPVRIVVTDDDPAVGTVTVRETIQDINDPHLRFFGRNLTVEEHEDLSASDTILTFTHSDPDVTAAELTATINWGDGTATSQGTIVKQGDQFLVTGEHKYKREGAFSIQVTINTGSTNSVGVSSIMVLGKPLQGIPKTVKAPKATAVIATFIAPGEAGSYGGSFRAEIEPGSGPYRPASVVPTPPISTETTRDGVAGTENMAPVQEVQTITLNSNPTGGTFVLSFRGKQTYELPYDASASAVQAALWELEGVDSVSVSGGDGGPYIVTFGGQHANKNVDPITADGSKLTGRQNSFDVIANIDESTPSSLKIRIFEGQNGRLEITSTVEQPTSTPGSPNATSNPPSEPPPQSDNPAAQMSVIETKGISVRAEEGVEFSGAVATFSGSAEGWEVKIDWGDGETSDGTLEGGEIKGTHTYEKPGAYRITVGLRKQESVSAPSIYEDPLYYHGWGWGYWPWSWYWNDPYYAYGSWGFNGWFGYDWWYNGHWSGGVASGVLVESADFELTAGSEVEAEEGEELEDIVVATSDAGDNAIAVIEWGDGKTSEGQVENGDVTGSHTYENPGSYRIRVTVRDGSKLETTIVKAKIAPEEPEESEDPPEAPVVKPLKVLELEEEIDGDEDVELEDIVVATIEDKNPRHIGGLHLATIYWGDGTQSKGKIEHVEDFKYRVIGSHTYRDAGAFAIRVEYVDQADRIDAWTTAIISAPAIVGVNGDTVEVQDIDTGVGLQLNDIVVAEFKNDNPDSKRTAKDYSATIHWGDGTTSAAKIVQFDGKFLVYGSHTYGQVGEFELVVNIEDGPTITQVVQAVGKTTVGLSYEGGGPIDVFANLAGRRIIRFDDTYEAHDTNFWQHDYAGSWGGSADPQSAVQHWEHYAGIARFDESIEWGDDTTNELHRYLGYAKWSTEGTFGDHNQEGWGGYYGWGYGWGGYNGDYYAWPGYYGWGGYGWGGWYGTWGGVYGGWPGWYGYGYSPYWGFGSGWHGWGAWWGGYGYYGDMRLSADGETFADGSTEKVSSDSYEHSGPFGSYSANWSHELTPRDATYNHSWSWSNSWSQGMHEWEHKHYAYPWGRYGSTLHVYQDAGNYSLSTTFGLSREIHIGDGALQNGHLLPTLHGNEAESISAPLLTFTDTSWFVDASGFTAEIDWGDGDSSTATIDVTPDNRFRINADHEYDEDGLYTIVILVSSQGGSSRIFQTAAKIVDKTLAATAIDIRAAKDESTGEILVATLDTWQGANDRFTAVIDWGDRGHTSSPPSGSSGSVTAQPHLSRGRVVFNEDMGKIEIWGSHKYAHVPAEPFKVRVQISDGATPPLVVEGKATITDKWRFEAIQRTNGFDEGYQESFGPASVALNTGSLLLAHDLDFDLSPGTSIGRDPMLVFNSSTVDVRPIFEGLIQSEAVQNETPTKIEVRVTWDGGEPEEWKEIAIANHQAGNDYVVAAQLNEAVKQSGIYAWRLQIRISFGDDEADPKPIEMEEGGLALVVVNERGDADTEDPFDFVPAYHAGWSFSILDRLILEENGDVLWTTGSGGSRAYIKQPNGDYKGPKNDWGELEFDEEKTVFTYTAKGETKYEFNHLGLLTKITTPDEQEYDIEYDEEGRIAKVTAPDGQFTNTFTTFNYGDESLETIVQPGNRTVTVAAPSNSSFTITDAEGNVREFTRDTKLRVTAQKWAPYENVYHYDPQTGLLDRVELDATQGSVYVIVAQAAAGLKTTAVKTEDAVAVITDPAPYTPGAGSFNRDTKYKLDAEGRILEERRPDGVKLEWTRDEFHNVTWYKDARGQMTFHAYKNDSTGKGDLLSVSAPGEGSTVFTYHPKFHLVESVRDGRGNYTTFQYNDKAQLVTTTDEFGNTIVNTWVNNRIESTKDKRGNYTTYEYDSNGRLMREWDALAFARGYVTTYTYDTAGNLQSVLHNNNGLNGSATSYVFDKLNRLVQETNAAGHYLAFTYTAAGLIATERNRRGAVTLHEYDRRGYEYITTEAYGTAMAMETVTFYHPDGSVYRVADPHQQLTTSLPDANPANRKVTVTDPLGGSVTTVYDEAGNAVEIIGSQGRTTKYEYDGANRLEKIIPNAAYPSIYVKYTYDEVGNLTSERDELGHVTSYTYDELNRAETITLPGHAQTTYQYDPNGNVILVVNPRGAETAYGYDELDRLNRVGLYDDGLVVAASGGYSYEYDYDPNGNRIWEKDPRGNVTNYEYNNLDQLIGIWQPNPATGDHGRPVTYKTYDENGNPQSQLDPMGRLVTYQYDILDRLTAVVDTEGDVQYSHSSEVHPQYGTVAIEQVSDKMNRVTTRVYDPLGRLIETRLPSEAGNPLTIKNVYNNFGQLWYTTDQLGRQSWYTYDDFNRLTYTSEKLESQLIGELVMVEARTYHDDGSIKSTTDRAGTDTTFHYDPVARKETVDTEGAVVERYFDGAGNLTAVKTPNNDVVTYAYDDLNRLESETIVIGGVSLKRTYDYDEAGNLIHSTDRNGRGIDYGYDALNRRISETWIGLNGSPTGYYAHFSYYADGRPHGAQDGYSPGPHSAYEFEYDELGRANYVAFDSRFLPSESFEFEYSHDVSGKVDARRVNSNGLPLFTTYYGYDAYDRLDLVTESGSAITGKELNYNYTGPLLSTISREQVQDNGDRINVGTSSMGYDGNFRLGNLSHNVPGITAFASHAVEYDAAGNITRHATKSQGVFDSELRVPQFDSQRQLRAVKNDSQVTQVSYQYDSNGNRQGRRDPYDRLRDDAFNHYDYDNEGNVVRRDSYEQLAEQAIDTDMDLTWHLTGRSAVTLETTASLRTGKHRLRLSGMTINSTAFPGVPVMIIEADLGSSQFSQVIPLDLTDLGGGVYAVSEKIIEFELTANVPNNQLKVTFDFPLHADATEHLFNNQPDIHLSAGAYRIDRLDDTFVYEWDHHNRLVRAKVYSNPNPISTGPLKEISYSYDVLGNLIARVVDGANGYADDEARYFVYEQGRVLLEYDTAGRLDRQRLYAGAVDQLLAIEDLDLAPDGTVLSDEVVWIFTDHQGTVRDLVGVDSVTGTRRVEHLEYDPFGVPLQPNWNSSDSSLHEVVSSRFLGMTWDDEAKLYFAGDRPYDPYSGRLLSPSRAGYAQGDPNPYRFAGNSPVDAHGTGRPTLVNPQQTDLRSEAKLLYETYAYYLNPLNNDQDGYQYLWAGGKLLGWTMFVVGSAGAGMAMGAAGLAGLGASSTVAWTTAAGGTAAGMASGTIGTYSSNPQAGLHEYAFNMGVGGFFGGLAPVNSLVSAGAGGIGAGIAHRTGHDWKTGYMIGDVAGGILGGGVDDVLRAASKYRALGKGSQWGASAWHAARHAGVEGGVALGAGLGAYAATGSLDASLLAANIGSSVGSVIASKLVACFAAGTPLLTPEGSKPIERFAVGDLVLSRPEDDANAPVQARRVEEVFVNLGEILHLHVGDEVIRTTPEHPFFVLDKGWTPAIALEIGDLLSSHDGQWVPVTDLLNTGEFETTYNLRVAEYSTYFVGGDGWAFSVWAHNDYFGGLSKRQVTAFARKYAAQVNLNGGVNKGVKWQKIGDLTESQRSIVRDFARQNGLIDNLDKVTAFGPNGRYLDFGDLAYSFNGATVATLPRRLWKAGREAHFNYLNTKFFNGVQPDGWTWHHMPFNGQMQLVPRGLHAALSHDGGMSPGRWGYMID